jgi:tetratricopeptide (TPR) repeat protein
MKLPGLQMTILFWVMTFCSCAGFLHAPSPTGPAMLPVSAQHFRERALAHEHSGALRQALLAWQIAQAIEDNPMTRQAIDHLKRTMTTQADAHFKIGLSYYAAGDFGKARNSFLETIRIQPDHSGARYYLKTRLHTVEQAVYKVLRGDSYSKIALKIYGDPKKAQLIAYFNDHDPIKPLLAGTTLLLPVLDPSSLHPRPDINHWIAQAQKALDQNRYDTALALVDKIKKEIPDHPKVLQISDQAHFAKARALLTTQQYLAALKHLKQVRPSFKGREKFLAQARHHLLQQALDKNLQLAEHHLARQEYDSAINVTEEILSLYPSNAPAKALSNEAQYALGKQLLERGEYAAAIELLQKSDPSYKEIRQLLSLARARVRSQADAHYRKGVNYFINEELKQAIIEWRQSLALNPDHPKARQDIENAQHLLEKYQALETVP